MGSSGLPYDDVIVSPPYNRQVEKERGSGPWLDPVNAWVVIDPIEATDRVGSLFVANLKEQSYRRGRIKALPYALDEKVRHLCVGNVVIFDSLGAIQVGLGSESATLVKAVEIVAVVRE